MKNKNKKCYVSPHMLVMIMDLEQGIAAGSGASETSTPIVNDYENDGVGGTVWDVDSF